jgi:hypothetical protein
MASFGGVSMHASSLPRRIASVAFPCRLVKLVDGIRQALGIRSHIAPEAAVAPVAGAFHCVVHPLLVGHFAEEHMPKRMAAPHSRHIEGSVVHNYTTIYPNRGLTKAEDKKMLTLAHRARQIYSRRFGWLFFTLGGNQGRVRGRIGPRQTLTHPLPDAAARRGAPVGLQYGFIKGSFLRPIGVRLSGPRRLRARSVP